MHTIGLGILISLVLCGPLKTIYAQETVPTPTYGAPQNLTPADPSDNTPRQYEPDHPTCPEDGEVLLTFGTYHMIQGEPPIDEGYLFEIRIPDTFTARPGSVEVLQGEGHNWDENCPTINGPKDQWEELRNPCRDFQPEETVNIYWGDSRDNLQYVGGLRDHSPGAGNNAEDVDNVTTAYSFDVPLIRPGLNYLHLLQPPPRFPIENSVFIKGTFCAAPIPAAVDPTAVPTVVTPTPVPTYVYSPDIPGPDQRQDTVGRFKNERGKDDNRSEDLDSDSTTNDNEESESRTDDRSDNEDSSNDTSSGDEDSSGSDDTSVVQASADMLVDVGESPLPYTIIGVILIAALFFI